MNPGLAITPSPAGLLLAAGAVALGAPLFSDGLRALRLRRELARVLDGPLPSGTGRFAHARGLVALESPLFSPLGGLPCAGFVLEVEGEGTAVRRSVESRRSFRLVDGEGAARVSGIAGRWQLEPTATRRVAPGEAMSENVSVLLSGVPEVEWLRGNGVALVLRERALLAGRVCHVVGVARSTRPVAHVEEIVLERTGTDDLPVSGGMSTRSRAGDEPEVEFHPDEQLDFLLVSDREPSRRELSLSPLRVAGVVLGPALSLVGILYLAAVAELMRAAGRP
jgi:hypothetical protein